MHSILKGGRRERGGETRKRVEVLQQHGRVGKGWEIGEVSLKLSAWPKQPSQNLLRVASSIVDAALNTLIFGRKVTI